jgi:2-keto-4-pentenoate hydratase
MSDPPGESLADLAQQYVAAVRAGDHAPEALLGRLDLPTALELQLAVLRSRLDAGEELGGFKVGLTSARARQTVGADVRPFGYILASRILDSGAVVDSRAIRKGSVEAELCFTIGHRLAGEVSADDARAAVSRVAAGFELNEARPGSARRDLGLLVADDLTQWGIVEGTGKDIAGVGDLGQVECRVQRNGEQVYAGRSGDELDDHFASLAALAAVLAHHGQALEPGYKVITGAFCRFDLVPGDRWRADYSAIGEVDITVV